MNLCPKHNCPMVSIGDRDVCLLKHARSLIGQMILDLIVDDGLTVLLFSNGIPLPLIGWHGNLMASEDDESADGLLEVLDEMYLVGSLWDEDDHQMDIHIADSFCGIEGSQWILKLVFVRTI